MPVVGAAQAVGHEGVLEAGRSILPVRYALATRQRMRARLRADRPRPVDGLPAERQLHSERSEKRLPPPLEHAPGPFKAASGSSFESRVEMARTWRSKWTSAQQAPSPVNADPPAVEIPAAFVDDLFHKPGNRWTNAAASPRTTQVMRAPNRVFDLRHRYFGDPASVR